MAKILRARLAKRDDPIFREGPTFYTRTSDRLPKAELAKMKQGHARSDGTNELTSIKEASEKGEEV